MSETVSGEELEKINGYAREPLTEDKGAEESCRCLCVNLSNTLLYG